MAVIDSQLKMDSAMEQDSHTLIEVLANGGKSNSINDTMLTELRFSTEEIAAEEDLLEQRSLLTARFAVKFKMELETVNGILLNAQDHSWVKRSDLLLSKTHT
jgi:hypothetical protein